MKKVFVMVDKNQIQQKLLNDDRLDSLIDHTIWSKQLITKNTRVLIVDDIPMNLDILSQIIKKHGGKAYVATNGKEAIDVFKQNSVDIIIMDLHMPVMNGFEATYRIKALSVENFVPIIICTAFSSDEILSKAQACGADDIIEKPFSHDVFLSKVNNMLRHKAFYDKEKNLVRQLQQEIQKRKEVNAQLIAFQRQLEVTVEKKTAQLRQKDLELLEMDRISSIYTLAAGMAHEINNPLGFIKSSVDALKKMIHSCQRQTFTDKYERIFIRVDKGINRIINIIESLSYLSNVNKSNLLPVNINKSIQKAIEMIQCRDERIPIFSTSLSELPDITCIASEIHLCLMNVIQNAFDAVLEKNNGEICIKTQFNAQKQQILICVEDNGEGISNDKIRRVFDPFFTTRPVGHGTGVGLTLTERILSRYGGKISLESEEGKGTTVNLILPVSRVAD
jgi:signal transduction histidine kinase